MTKNKGWLFLLPSLLGVMVFFLLPYLDILYRSFMTVTGAQFVGFSNYKTVMENDAFHLALKNTFKFISVCIPLLLIFSLTIAFYIYENPRTSAALKTGFLVPMAIPTASTVLMWKLLFDRNGILNGMLKSIGLDVINWMDSDAVFGILVASYIWKNLGYHIILWLAALSAIHPSLREAAMMDGAEDWQRFRFVILPALKPAFFVISMLAILNSFKVFREAYLVAGDYPNDRIYLIQHLFNNWFLNLEMDKMAAGAVINSIVLIIFILLLQNFWGKRGE